MILSFSPVLPLDYLPTLTVGGIGPPFGPNGTEEELVSMEIAATNFH